MSRVDSKSTFEVWMGIKPPPESTFFCVESDLCRSEGRAFHPQPNHRRAKSCFPPEVDGANRILLHCDRRWPRLSGPQLHLPVADTGNTQLWNFWCCCYPAALVSFNIPQQKPMFIMLAVQHHLLTLPQFLSPCRGTEGWGEKIWAAIGTWFCPELLFWPVGCKEKVGDFFLFVIFAFTAEFYAQCFFFP